MVGAFHCFFIDPNNGNTTTGRRIPLFFIDPNNGVGHQSLTTRPLVGAFHCFSLIRTMDERAAERGGPAALKKRTGGCSRISGDQLTNAEASWRRLWRMRSIYVGASPLASVSASE